MPGIDDVVERIRELEHGRKQLGETLRDEWDGRIEAETVVEGSDIQEIEPASLQTASIAGVDGGLLQREFHGLDIIVTRAVAALFTFDGDSFDSADYVPEKHPRPRFEFIESPLDRQEFNISSSLLRLQREIDVALETVKKDPDMLLLDGSIVPQYTDRPAKGSRSREIYDSLVSSYQELFQQAQKNDVLLAGVIEDSRGTSLSEMLAEQSFIKDKQARLLRRTQDTNILQYVLAKGERTPVMRYTDEYEKHPTLKDIGEEAGEVYNFYLKAAEQDRPSRVDFLNLGDVSGTADRIASMLLPLCSFSSRYGIPSVLIEADKCAKLSEQDLVMLETKIRSRVGFLPGVSDLRRDSRPF